MSFTPTDKHVDAVRCFNRFYTRTLGLLDEHLLRSEFSLAEARVLYELANRDHLTAAAIAADLGIDPGYLSRILRKFRALGFLGRRTSPADGRQSLLQLTRRGRKAFAPLDRRSHDAVAALLAPLSPTEQRRLLDAMHWLEYLLGPRPAPDRSFVLRPPLPGDLGWIVHRHGALYAQEYGWDERFEALVAHVVADYLHSHDPKREHCWIAERDGENVGSVLVVRKTEAIAQLRLLLVEPASRGLGIGRRLVLECVRFARRARYKKIRLWTNDILHAARHLYEEAGFLLTHEEPHTLFGEGLRAQTWELTL
jgi:DNA-binding MarR family transcriptional regulator/N-acetylglutamate synthase-like GNAT family acetyltransferase